MAVEVRGTMIRIPQGDTGNVKFVADGELSESDKALFTIARRDGSAVLRKVLSVDASDKAFHLPFAYGETAVAAALPTTTCRLISLSTCGRG